jgi:hypothetical protein
MRIVAVIVEVAASRLTKIPISDQVCFLSNRLTAQSGPREPIVSKNRAGRERINLRRQDRSTPTAIDNGFRLIALWLGMCSRLSDGSYPRGAYVADWPHQGPSHPEVHFG